MASLTTHEIQTRVARTPVTLGFAYLLVLLGLALVVGSFVVGLVLTGVNVSYYSLDKASRDAAASGSTTLALLGVLQYVPAWLEPLRFLGLSTLLAGISLYLVTIVGRIRLRAEAMATALPELVKLREKKE